MEAGQARGGGAPAEGRIARGWRLTEVAWALIQRDPTMLAIALMAAVCAFAGAAAVLYFGGYLTSPEHSRERLAMAALVGLYPLTFVSVFFNVALAAAAAASFDGRPIGVRDALEIAWERLGRIAQWSLLSAGVGLLLNQVAARIPGGGRIAAWLVGAAWGVATIFAVPLLALEDAGPIEAVKGSGHLLRSKWGEGISGLVAIGTWTVLVALPAGFVLGAGVGLSNHQVAAGTVLIAVGLGALMAISAASVATRQVFAVALFRHATGGPAGGFPAADLEHPFAVKGGGRRGTHWLAYVALAAIALLVGIGAAIGPRHGHQAVEYREPIADYRGHAHVYFDRVPLVEREIRAGMPVLYEGDRIGSVILHRDAGSEEYVRYYVFPAYRRLPGGMTMELDPTRPSHPLLRLLPSTE